MTVNTPLQPQPSVSRPQVPAQQVPAEDTSSDVQPATLGKMDPAEKLEALTWIEKCATDNLKDHVASIQILKSEATATLTIFLTGMGATLGYLVNLISVTPHAPTFWGVLALLAYLFLLSGLLVLMVMRVAPAPAVTNEPLSLMQSEMTRVQILQSELENIQKRIGHARARTGRMGKWLNRIRGLLLLSPIVFGLAWYVARLTCGGACP